jgi:hypothetical protein
MLTDLMMAKIETASGGSFVAGNPNHDVGPLITAFPIGDFCGRDASTDRRVSIELVMPRRPQMHPRATIAFNGNSEFAKLATQVCASGKG